MNLITNEERNKEKEKEKRLLFHKNLDKKNIDNFSK
jgi:hypothetical protein